MTNSDDKDGRQWGEGPEGDSDVMAYINQHHLLMSLLYDLDLLPEQHMGKPRDGKEWCSIFAITNHWREAELARSSSAVFDVEAVKWAIDLLSIHPGVKVNPNSQMWLRKLRVMAGATEDDLLVASVDGFLDAYCDGVVDEKGDRDLKAAASMEPVEYRCTRCGKSDSWLRANWCGNGPCPMAPVPECATINAAGQEGSCPVAGSSPAPAAPTPAALSAEQGAATVKDSLIVRPCTCHPDDNPPRPCPQKYALSECRAAFLASLQPPAQGNAELEEELIEAASRLAMAHGYETIPALMRKAATALSRQPSQQGPSEEERFIAAFKEWYVRDGSVGGLSTLVKDHAITLRWAEQTGRAK